MRKAAKCLRASEPDRHDCVLPHLVRAPRLILLLCLSLSVSHSWAAPYFRESGLVNIPTGTVVEHGIFGVGAYFAFQNDGELLRDETAIRLDFGLSGRAEIGVTSVGHSQERFLLGNLKILLLREAEVMPNITVGVENIGGKTEVENQPNDLTRYERNSAFLAASKTFNLPSIHLISGHIGIGNHRFVGDTGIGKVLNGLFFGVGKEFHPSFARGDMLFSVEVAGSGVNLGLRHTTESGLQIDLGAEALNPTSTDEREIRYLMAVSWTNRTMMKRMEDLKNLAKRAGELASEAKQAAQEAKRKAEQK